MKHLLARVSLAGGGQDEQTNTKRFDFGSVSFGFDCYQL
jgi:hypothetical protein